MNINTTEYTSFKYAQRALNIDPFDLDELLNDQQIDSKLIDNERIVNKDALFNSDYLEKRMMEELNLKSNCIKLIHGVAGLYGITFYGDVVNLTTMHTLKKMKTRERKKNNDIVKERYEYVDLFVYKSGNMRVKEHKTIHKLVAQEWCKNDLKKTIVHHIDGDMYNNDFRNLIWVTTAEHTELHALFNKEKYDDYHKMILDILAENGEIVPDYH